jgi:hypothetical protein
LEQYVLQATLTGSNAFLMVNYSIPAGPGAWVPTISFAGGAGYLLLKMAALDTLAAIEGASALPQRVRDTAATLRQKLAAVDEHKIPQWAIALGLVQFGADYLFRNALPKLTTAGPHPITSVPLALAPYPIALGLNYLVHRVKAAVTARNGALAYPNPAASGTPAGLFRQKTPITLTGDAHTDANGTVWVKVSGTELSGKELTGWVDVRVIDHVSISGPAGAQLYAGPSSSSQALDVLAPGTPLTPTGSVESEGGKVWVEVTITEDDETRRGWIDGATIGPGPAPPDPNGISPV